MNNTNQPPAPSKNIVTTDRLVKFFNRTPRATVERYQDHLVKAMAKFDISTPNRISAFLAQINVESGGLQRTEENLNYSAKRLMEVFPRYFRNKEISLYAMNPERIANLVYGNRMGNGPESSGDGWRYRGRGFIQITGKSNYQAFANAMGMSLEDATKYMTTDEGAAMSAAWFWSNAKLNPLADAGDIDNISRIINAGPGGSLSSVHGLDDRREGYKRAMTIFS
jgi:putative chitinase